MLRYPITLQHNNKNVLNQIALDIYQSDTQREPPPHVTGCADKLMQVILQDECVYA